MSIAEILIVGGLSLFGGVSGYTVWWVLQRRGAHTEDVALEDDTEAAPPAMPEELVEPPLPTAAPDGLSLEQPPEAAVNLDLPEPLLLHENHPAEDFADGGEVSQVIDETTRVAAPEIEFDARLTSIETTLRDMAAAQAALLEQDAKAAPERPAEAELLAQLEAQSQKLDNLQTALAELKDARREPGENEDGGATETLAAILAAIEGLPGRFDAPISEKVLPHLALLSQDVATLEERLSNLPDPRPALAELSAQVSDATSAPPSPEPSEIVPTPSAAIGKTEPTLEEDVAAEPNHSAAHEDPAQASASEDTETSDTVPHSRKSGIAYIPADAKPAAHEKGDWSPSHPEPADLS